MMPTAMGHKIVESFEYEKGLLDDMRDDFSRRAGVIGDGYSDTDSTDLVYGLMNHSNIPMVGCYAISHLLLYIITYRYTNESLTLCCVHRMIFLSFLEKNLKFLLATLRKYCSTLSKYGFFQNFISHDKNRLSLI